MLFRLFVLGTLLLVNLYACKGGYASCVAKVKDSNAIRGKSLYIPITKTTRLVYSHNKPYGKILKHDPFLSLYLVTQKESFAYPFDINIRLQLGTAMVTDKGSCEGRFIEDQIGLDNFARYNEVLLIPSLVTSSCCSLEGIVSSRGIIQKEYLNHFVKSKNVAYGDIGVRLKNNNRKVIVTACDPFVKNNLFLKGDIIVSYDGKHVTNAAEVMRTILFSKIGTKHTVEIKRGKKHLVIHPIIYRRYGGGFISDTFLESKGLYFDENLHLTKISGVFQNYGLMPGDRLLQVNGKKVKTQKALREYIENYKDYSSLLFERNGFQFFVNIK